jgi:hypothetical protein
MQENNNWKNDWCGFYFRSLNRICSRTTEIERWIQESDTSRNNRSRFHCTLLPWRFGLETVSSLYYVQRTWENCILHSAIFFNVACLICLQISQNLSKKNYSFVNTLRRRINLCTLFFSWMTCRRECLRQEMLIIANIHLKLLWQVN